MSEKKAMEMPTHRTSVVTGHHYINSTLEMLNVLVLARKDLIKPLQPVQLQLRAALGVYRADITNFESELELKDLEAHNFATKLIEMTAAWELEKAAVRAHLEENERLKEQLHQKNVGFAEAMQAKNKECSEWQNKYEVEQELRKNETAQRNNFRDQVEAYRQQINSAYKRITQIANWAKRKGIKLPSVKSL